jgi:bifunctional non-homologous end joining protein LigD
MPHAGASKPTMSTLPVTQALLSHPDRVLYPERGVTKAQLALYYARVAPFMLPHLERRLLTLVRCPEGQAGECFFQKHPMPGLSPAVRRLRIRERTAVARHMFVDDSEGLMALVQQCSLEIHVWGSRIDRLEVPDQLVFDLDPDASVTWPALVQAARALREELLRIDLPSFVKTTGGKGLHVVTPIAPRLPWDDAKAFSKAVVERLSHREPERYVATMSKAKRKGKIFLDYLRNSRGATAICPYSTRAGPDALVATPIAWDELDPRAPALSFDLSSVPERLAHGTRDPWASFDDARPRITGAMQRAVGLRQPS